MSFTNLSSSLDVLKMLYLIGAGGLVNRGFVNFQNMVLDDNGTDYSVARFLPPRHHWPSLHMQIISDFPMNRILRRHSLIRLFFIFHKTKAISLKKK